MGMINTMPRQPTIPGIGRGIGPGRRSARHRLPLGLSALLFLIIILMPLALLLLGRLLPGSATESGPLAQAAATAAGRVAASLDNQSAALRRIEDALAAQDRDAAAGRPSRAALPIGMLLAGEPALQGARLLPRDGAEDGPALIAGRALAVAPAPEALAAALAGAGAEAGLRLQLIGPDGRILAHWPDRTAEDGTMLAARHGVAGWPLQVLAEAALATPLAAGLVPLGTAVLAVLLLALFAHRWEGEVRCAAEAEERREAQRSVVLAESATRLRLALGAAELGCCSWDDASDAITWDARAADILGWRKAGVMRGDALRERVEPADHPLFAAALASGRRGREPVHCVLRLRTAGAPRWIELRVQASPGPRGLRWHGVIADITARREVEEAQQRLLHEVDHRAKNTLAVVQALLRLSRTEGPAGLPSRAEARIAVLARAHTLLAQSRWEGAPLDDLARAELQRRPAEDEDLPSRLSGPPVMLSPVAAQPVAMVLHELASNAAQYGALAAPGGSLDLSWRLLPETGLELVWQERRAGPLPPGPVPTGFGTRILDATVRNQLAGRISREWRADGLRCVIRLPAACLVLPPTTGAPVEGPVGRLAQG